MLPIFLTIFQCISTLQIFVKHLFWPDTVRQSTYNSKQGEHSPYICHYFSHGCCTEESNSVSLGYMLLVVSALERPTLQKREPVAFHKQFSWPFWETNFLSDISSNLFLCNMKLPLPQGWMETVMDVKEPIRKAPKFYNNRLQRKALNELLWNP